ncbi:MAG: bacterial/archaeal transporter family-2 protein [Actinomycetota bacterium]
MVDDERGPSARDDAERSLPSVAIALAAGVLGAIQPEINAELGERIGSAVLASLVNFCAAFAVVVVVIAMRPRTRRTLRALRSWPVPPWMLTAGLGGVIVVMSGVIAVPTIGVVIFSVAFFAGQITFGLVVDRVGLGSGVVRPIVAARAQAALLAIAAVVVSQFGRPVGEFSPVLVAFVFAAGAASAFQSAFNGRIAGAVGDPFAPTAVNVTVGVAALGSIVAALAAAGRLDAPSWPTEPWLYTGGLLGVTIVLSLAISSASLGVLRATLAMLAAQLVTAFVVDWAVDHAAPRPGVIVGTVLIAVAVVLVGRSRIAAGDPQRS